MHTTPIVRIRDPRRPSSCPCGQPLDVMLCAHCPRCGIRVCARQRLDLESALTQL